MATRKLPAKPLGVPTAHRGLWRETRHSLSDIVRVALGVAPLVFSAELLHRLQPIVVDEGHYRFIKIVVFSVDFVAGVRLALPSLVTLLSESFHWLGDLFVVMIREAKRVKAEIGTPTERDK
jgi:hypothetical protein